MCAPLVYYCAIAILTESTCMQVVEDTRYLYPESATVATDGEPSSRAAKLKPDKKLMPPEDSEFEPIRGQKAVSNWKTTRVCSTFGYGTPNYG